MIFDYPYTDMHELNLDWFLARFKEYYEHITEQDQKITTLEETVEQFTSFVTNYFDNLDVQTEINNKLDALVADGTLKNLLEPYFDELVADVTSDIASQDNKIAALEGRMDEFSRLEEGSTSGDAELADIRVAYNGYTYPNAGDAVRGQVNFLFSNLKKPSNNLLNAAAKASSILNGLTYSMDDNNNIKISGTSNASTDLKFNFSTPLNIEADTLYMFCLYGIASATSATIYLYEGGTVVKNISLTLSSLFNSFSLSNDHAIDKMMIRFANNATVNVDAKIQISKGDTYLPYMSYMGVPDHNERKVNPVFSNGYFSSYKPAEASDSSFGQWVITRDLIHVKKGSYIAHRAGKTMMYVTIYEYDIDDQYQSTLYNANLTSIYTFDHDCYVRIAARTTSYDYIYGQKFYDNYGVFIYSDDYDPKTQIVFIGLGTGSGAPSGQSQLVLFSNGKVMMIDSHLNTNYTYFHNVIKKYGVRRIDYYIQSHWHADHCAIGNILEYQPNWVDMSGCKVYLPMELTNDNISQISEASTLVTRQNDITQLFTDAGCDISRPTNDIVLHIDGIDIKFYNADQEIYSDVDGGYYSTNYNDWSLCCEICIGDNIINIAADIGPIAESRLAGSLRKATILTAPHHGWDNGPNNLIPAFINNVNPDVVVSVNGWEHNPANENSAANILLNTSAMQSFCEANAVSNYCTFNNGPISICIDRYNWVFNGRYSRYIRNGKNWKFNDNTDNQE